MCRDRHIFLCGNIPNFWDLDTSFTSRVRFYVYIFERGRAWVFEQENNPFTTDKWNAIENRKTFRKKKNPYSCPNFICEIHYPDWDDKEKEEYYKIRNTKRIEQFGDNKSEKKERYATVKNARNAVLKYFYHDKQKIHKFAKEMLEKYPQHEVLVMPENIKEKFKPHYDKLMKLKEMSKPETHKELAEVMEMSPRLVGQVLDGTMT